MLWHRASSSVSKYILSAKELTKLEKDLKGLYLKHRLSDDYPLNHVLNENKEPIYPVFENGVKEYATTIEGLVSLIMGEDIKVEVVEKETSGFLGLNKKPAKVRVALKETMQDKAVNFLEDVFKLMEIQSEITVDYIEEEKTMNINIVGEDMGVLIGKRGQTLDSLQYLVSLVANNGGGHYRISLNIGNYREKREETLINLAKRISEQVLKTGKCRSLEPMNPYERRIIHTTVQGIEGVTSSSFGEGSNRRVVIGVEGGEMRPPRSNNRRDNRSRNRKVAPKTVDAPAREPKKDSDIPLYGKIN